MSSPTEPDRHDDLPRTLLGRPSVAGCLLYVACFTLLVLWMMRSLDERTFAAFVLRERLLGLNLFHLLSVANGTGIAVLLLDVGAARRSRRPDRSARFWGLLLALALMVGVQVATFAMRSAAEALAGG